VLLAEIGVLVIDVLLGGGLVEVLLVIVFKPDGWRKWNQLCDQGG
jgi:hypothetical protein